MKTNLKAMSHRFSEQRLAGGFGALAARQDEYALLRRAVLANLLWEDLAYQHGHEVAEQIARLVPRVEPQRVFDLAVEAKLRQNLRHVPLFLAREMARHPTHRHLVADLLERIIIRPDDATEFLALYWREGRCPLASGVKRGLARAFTKFDAYQLAKYKQAGQRIKLRDVMFLVHPSPVDQAQAEIWRQFVEGTLPPPDTWEVALSRGADKRETFTRLIRERKLGALAFLRNLRLMTTAGVDEDTIRYGFSTINPRWLLPSHYLSAATQAAHWRPEIQELMLRGLQQAPRLTGTTILIVDVSGSMWNQLSAHSIMSRLDVAAMLATLVREVSEHVRIFATGGIDSARIHRTEEVDGGLRGFDLAYAIGRCSARLGGGGIFTRQALEYVRGVVSGDVERIIVFSDSQDCDLPDRRTPAPFGRYNYIVDVSAHTHGVAYDRVWTAEIVGWSERIIDFVYAYEGIAWKTAEEE